MDEDIFSIYLSYTSNMECPAWFHRWSLITSIGAMLGRQVSFKHGHFEITPNLYTMLVGTPGTRKSTGIKLAKKLIIQAGYTSIAASKTTKEKFLMDLAGESDAEPTGFGAKKSYKEDEFLDDNLFGTRDNHNEVFVMADEFNNFIGNGNIEFISILGELWDYSGTYTNRIKNGKSISIKDPLVSILGGNTPTNLSIAFPQEVIGQGFFSRLLLIYGESNGKRIAFPEPPDVSETDALVNYLRAIKNTAYGNFELTKSARQLLERIYSSGSVAEDVRFEYYFTRRFTHLLKLCTILCATRLCLEINERDVISANTLLTHAENFMPKALGEFGKSKHSDVAHKIIQFIDSQPGITSFKAIWKCVCNDIDKQSDLATIMQNLLAADKIQTVNGNGFLPKKSLTNQVDSSILDYSILTEEEKAMKK